MIDQASTADPSITVEIIARPPHTSFLVVHYDGLQPPKALFADLEMIGWKPPVLAPPPRTAIDWSTPNEATGESFTVRNWRVDGAIVEPPAGSGPRGSWNPHEGDAFLRSMRGVLQRHGVSSLDVDGRMHSAARLPPAPSTTTGGLMPAVRMQTPFPKRRKGLRALSGKIRDAADAASTPTRSAAAAKASPGGDASVELLSLVLSIPEDGRLAIRATAAPGRFPAIEDGLRALAVDVWFTTEEHEERQTFRGSSVSTTVMKFKITVLAASDVAAEAVTVLEEQGAKFEVEVLDAEGAAAWAEAADVETGATETEEDDDDDFAMIRLRFPCVHLIVEPMRAESVVDVIHRLGLQHARKRPAELESIGVYRGTNHVTRKPAIAFDVWAPAAHASRVMGELAVVGGVDPDRQPDQAWISAPEPRGPLLDIDVLAKGEPSPTHEAEITGATDPKASREVAPDPDGEPLDIEGDGAGLIDETPQLADVTNRQGSGDEVLTHR